MELDLLTRIFSPLKEKGKRIIIIHYKNKCEFPDCRARFINRVTAEELMYNYCPGHIRAHKTLEYSG